ncbi:MAG: SGNH/GDSL hydrolase family protein, partial [Anaerolineales bacterium]|nr:SGNH/GDSL hydrolase family protein [Anaerolineales bacterium]
MTETMLAEILPTSPPQAVLVQTPIILPVTLTPIPVHSPTFTPSPTITPTSTPDTRPLPRAWRTWPVIPMVSSRAVEIYRRGQEMGVAPYTFSVVGDCQSEPQVFLGIYATNRNPIGPDYPHLLETIQLFYDSFWRDSVAVRDGLSAPSALDPLWSDPTRCQPGESPLACELRTYRPMIVFVNLGTNWRPDVSVTLYEKYLRQIVEQIIASGAVPILTNKADNIEGDFAINRVTAQIAYEYDVPY